MNNNLTQDQFLNNLIETHGPEYSNFIQDTYNYALSTITEWDSLPDIEKAELILSDADALDSITHWRKLLEDFQHLPMSK